jgi:hypothetical protein
MAQVVPADGYVEVEFEGIFPANPAMGSAGPAAVTFAGWIDGETMNGRVRVANRAEGTVTLSRHARSQVE